MGDDKPKNAENSPFEASLVSVVKAISEERDGRIAVLDPAFRAEKYTREDLQDLVDIKNDIIAICDMQVVVDDTAPAEPSFYLFWRK